MSGAIFGYHQSNDYLIAEKLKTKYRRDVEVLEREGFSFSSLHQEVLWPFSAILFFPTFLIMLMKDYARVKSPLRITSYHLQYALQKEATVAYVYGLGCKYYTKFTDGTWLVSNTAQIARDEKIIVLQPALEGEPLTAEQIWQRHREKVQELLAQGKQLGEGVSFEQWVSVESKFDQGSLLKVLISNIPWLAFFIYIIYLLGSLVVVFLRAIR